MSFSDVTARKTRVLIADDSDLMRRLLVEIINASMDFRVIGQARTGYEAIRLVHELNPDVVTLDLQMPDLGGLETLGYIMSEAPRPVVVVSSYVGELARPAILALEYGAVDVVAKPAGDDARDVDVLGDRLLDALRAANAATLTNLRVQRTDTARTHAKIATMPQSGARSAVAIAASTGGPRALTEVVPKLPAELNAAVLIVQHMPASFTGPFAERLDSLSDLTVKEAEDGELVRAGRVYVAPGGVHMSLKRSVEGAVISLENTDPLWGVRPAADVLFNAVAKLFGPASGGVVLTGMGRDGADGLRAIRDVGGWTAVQDAESCVVWGMPKIAAPYADEALPIQKIADTLSRKSQIIAKRRRV